MSITIRACRPGDEAALALVGQATFLETYAGVLPAADIVSHCRTEHGEALYAAWLAKPGYNLWAAEMDEGGAAVGYAALTPPDLPVPTGEKDVELKRIYLLNRFHGTGLGAKLMTTAMEAAAHEGFTRMLLGVFGGNSRAIAFYARQGYVEAGVRKFRVGANEYDDLVLARAL
ncbi:GNAT family N-acetyltransferase [Phenylobacterium sp.]|uniref:GNAT family N-acetyltransferase n=1 Tax=Phenylobacterium sp. TaxID=1871053 RepID=UPI00273624DA|nr:GNAT family N-acetyltransferase [Phenylobacterium sp.]MDP3853579.1 GNAT family N-acetyltransferase [Phenylobacterium sp.]